jgi:hypothetical protein
MDDNQWPKHFENRTCQLRDQTARVAQTKPTGIGIGPLKTVARPMSSFFVPLMGRCQRAGTSKKLRSENSFKNYSLTKYEHSNSQYLYKNGAKESNRKCADLD